LEDSVYKSYIIRCWT